MKNWKLRFLIFLPTFFICLVISAAMGPVDNPVLFYQPVFFAGIYTLLGMSIMHDIDELKKFPDEEKTVEMPLFPQSSISKIFNASSFSRFIIQARLLAISITVIAMFSDSYNAFRNLFYYLLN